MVLIDRDSQNGIDRKVREAHRLIRDPREKIYHLKTMIVQLQGKPCSRIASRKDR